MFAKTNDKPTHTRRSTIAIAGGGGGGTPSVHSAYATAALLNNLHLAAVAAASASAGTSGMRGGASQLSLGSSPASWKTWHVNGGGGCSSSVGGVEQNNAARQLRVMPRDAHMNYAHCAVPTPHIPMQHDAQAGGGGSGGGGIVENGHTHNKFF